jgi:hypothetical protein
VSKLRHVRNLALVTALPAAFVLWHFPDATENSRVNTISVRSIDAAVPATSRAEPLGRGVIQRRRVKPVGWS